MDLMQLQSPETERALLGALIMEPEILQGLDIAADDFCNGKHRIIFQVVDGLAARQEAVDYITVCSELDKRKQLDEIGGPAFVTSLIGTPGMSWAAPTYARELREKTRRRALVAQANRMAQDAYDQRVNIDECIPGYVNGLVSAAAVNQGAQHISQTMSELYDDVYHRMQNPTDIWGIPTGYTIFDNVTGGLQLGELMILAGTPAVGKSILGMNFAAGMAETAPGAIYSMEMKRSQVGRRLVSGHGQIPTRAMKTGRMEERDVPVFINAIEHFSHQPIYIADSQGWTTTSLRADLARLRAQHGIKWFVLDYLYLLNDGGEDEIERTQRASIGLKRACSELNLAGIAIHSLNKSGMGASRKGNTGGDGLPNGLDDLRGSGQVAYDTDLACFLTKYSAEALPDLQVEPQLRDYTRILWFGKGRELENPRQYVPFMQANEKNQAGRVIATFPAFVEVEEHVQSDR